MVKVIFIEEDGTTHEVDAEAGNRVLDVALNNDIPGIVGDCGGELACATCHAYVDKAFFDKLDKPGEVEIEMLECAMEPRENSRLTCQITLSEDLDGLVLHLPAIQI